MIFLEFKLIPPITPLAQRPAAETIGHGKHTCRCLALRKFGLGAGLQVFHCGEAFADLLFQRGAGEGGSRFRTTGNARAIRIKHLGDAPTQHIQLRLLQGLRRTLADRRCFRQF